MHLFFPPEPMIYLFHIHFGLLSKLPGAINHHRCDSCSHESGQYKPPRLPVEQGFGLLKRGREHAEGTEMGTSTPCPRAICSNSCPCAAPPLQSASCALDCTAFQSNQYFSVCLRDHFDVASPADHLSNRLLFFPIVCLSHVRSTSSASEVQNYLLRKNHGFKDASF